MNVSTDQAIGSDDISPSVQSLFFKHATTEAKRSEFSSRPSRSFNIKRELYSMKVN